MPNIQSQSKVDLTRPLGAEVYPVPAVVLDNNETYNHQAHRHAERLRNLLWKLGRSLLDHSPSDLST